MWVGPVYFYFIFIFFRGVLSVQSRVVWIALKNKKVLVIFGVKGLKDFWFCFSFFLPQNSVLSTSLSDPVRYKPRGVKMIANSERDLKVNNDASFPLHVITLRNCGRCSFQMINLFA